MRKYITVPVDEDVYGKFCMAMDLAEDSEEKTLENCMRWYIEKTSEQTSQTYQRKTATKTAGRHHRDYYGKAIHRIPLWAKKPYQYNHKIIRAYFRCLQITGRATVEYMELLCSEKGMPELYVPTFKSNYAQMKYDGPQSHGKVFEDDGETVTIWSEVEDILMQYKSCFSNG